MKPSASWATCRVTCTVVERVDIRLTVNPGPTGTRVDVNMLRVGGATRYLGSQFHYVGEVYAGSSLRKTGTVSLNQPGSGTLWVTPYTSLKGLSFRYRFVISTSTPGGAMSHEYKTGTGTCTSASTPTCKWPL